MTLDHISESGDERYVSGRILNTDLAGIRRVMVELYGDDQVRLRDNNDLVVSGPLLFLEIYFHRDSGHGGEDYLLGGRLRQVPTEAYLLLSALGTALQRSGIVYSFEMYDESVPGEPPIVIEHPRFREQSAN